MTSTGKPPRGASPATIPADDGAPEGAPSPSVLPGSPADARPVGGAFYALTFRNFRLFFVGQIISVAGTWMQSVAQNWFVWQLTHSARWLGIVNGASALPFVLFAVWGGQIADRYSRRAILVWTQTAAMVLAFVLAALATGRWITPLAWHVAAISAVSSVVNAFNMPAQQAFVTDMVDDRNAISNAIALNSLRFNLARFLGPILAGEVLVRSSVAACFFINGISFIAVIISLLMMRLPAQQLIARSTSPWEGFAYVWQEKRSLRVIMLVGFSAVFLWCISTIYPVFAALYHAGARGYSMMMSANGIGAALAGLALAVYADRFGRRVLVYGGCVAFCLALLALSAAPTLWAALIALGFSGFSMITFGISANTTVQEEAPDALRGRVMAIYSLVFNGLFPLGGLEIGYLTDHIGPGRAVRLDAVLGGAIVLAIWLWSRADRRRPAPTLIE